ncbi:MAG: hypothetical protein WBD50_01220 [Candidatus Rhabdochlamydia sp.]
MSCSVHAASAICILRFLREQKKTGKAGKNNSFPGISTQLGLKKTIPIAEKWIKQIAETTNCKNTLKNISIIQINQTPQSLENSKILDP